LLKSTDGPESGRPRETLDTSGTGTGLNAFGLVPNCESYRLNAYRPGLSAHSVGDEFPSKLEVMVDGRSAYEPLLSTVNWRRLSIKREDIDHIAVRGLYRRPAGLRGSDPPMLTRLDIASDLDITSELNIASKRLDLEHSHPRPLTDPWCGICTLRIRLLRPESGNDGFIESTTRIDAQVSHRFSVGRSRGKIRPVVQHLTDNAKPHQANAFSTTPYFDYPRYGGRNCRRPEVRSGRGTTAVIARSAGRRIGAMSGPTSMRALDELEAAVTRRHQTFRAANIPTEDNAAEARAPVIYSAGLFLAIPGRGVFNHAIAQSALYLSFRERSPVIGFSKPRNPHD